ncbi:MAG: glycosyltransferase family 4 protein, partial [Patescibacteria group bacterium]
MTDSNKKIKVLIIMPQVDYSDRAAVNFCKGMNRNIFEIKALAYYGEVGGRGNDFSDIGVELVFANGNLEVIAEAIKKWQIEAIHMHRSGHYVPIELEIFRRAKSINPNMVILETNVFGKYDQRNSSFIDCSLQISKMMLNERYVKEVGYFDFEKTKIAYNPVDCEGWDKIGVTDDEVKAFKNKIGIKENDFVIGKSGRPHIAKWSDLLLRTMPYLVKLVPNVKFIVQEMPSSRKKRVLGSKYKNYYVLLDQTFDDRQVALFYKSIDVYVHASKIGESFGMTLAEAGVFKKPVVVNSTPNRDNNQLDLIEHMKTGIIANYPQTFARAIEYLYKNKDTRIKMGEAARAKIAVAYAPKRIAEQLEKVIHVAPDEREAFA